MSVETQNAYQILGVSETASPEEIRTAYERQAERYSEANYLGSPLWDMAAEKRRSIEAAYRLLSGDKVLSAAETDPIQPDETTSDRSSSVNIRVRSLLNHGNLEDALSLLNAQPDRDSNPEWIYLRGIAAWRRGWVDEANGLVRRAAAAVPTNQEYQKALDKLRYSPPPISKRDKEERLMRCCRENGPECGLELCCGCLCEGVCDSIDCS